MITPKKTQVETLGLCAFPSPLKLSAIHGDGIGNFVPDDAHVRYQVESDMREPHPDVFFEKAGPREKLFFDPKKIKAAIVTCGGLCPGLNNVIRSAFLELHFNYGVKDVLGIRYGFEGLNPKSNLAPIRLTPEIVDDCHRQGGSILGSSRGAQDVGVMVDFLVQNQIDLLLCVGGDGTQRGAQTIALEVRKRGLPIAIVGIPKTVDNDIHYVRQTFGFFTAIETAAKILDGAHAEAKGARNGIGLVKVMGRDSGFIAVGSTLASQEVNFTLIPEIPLILDGEKGFLNVLKQRILSRQHALIVVAEGAGQDLMIGDPGHDASGNKLQKDIGIFLKNEITRYFAAQQVPISLKYIDPSYIIRSVPADAEDSLLCDQFARKAVHAAMAGKTNVLVGYWYGCFTHVPIALAVETKKSISPESELWTSVIAATGQSRSWA
ncbi:MAG TPA: ATP-dependent 6-phosphofructokinase [Verrucomicrobia bacterium]|nr:ATP-dependent 6-phosphofructokinase [Verrucomicrobiota bacterium]